MRFAPFETAVLDFPELSAAAADVEDGAIAHSASCCRQHHVGSNAVAEPLEQSQSLQTTGDRLVAESVIGHSPTQANDLADFVLWTERETGNGAQSDQPGGI